MRIGVDASCWGNKRGFGRFTRELLKAVLDLDRSNEYVFFIDDVTNREVSLPPAAETQVVGTQTSQIKAASASGRRSLGDLWSMSRAVSRERLDVFFFPAVYSYFPILNRSKVVVTLHDMIADHNPALIFPNIRSKVFWKLKQNLAVRQADLVLTVSEHSKHQIEKYFGLSGPRLRVINEAADPVFGVLPSDELKNALNNYGLHAEEKFLLYVGGISPHKNLDTLIAAFDIILQDQRTSDLKLVLVGDYKDDPFFSAYPSLKRQIAGLGLEDKIVFTGFVPDKDLAALYNSATLLVFPSFEEGFGLPAIEAMACGTPVAASDRGSLPEVLGPAGRFFDPLDKKSIAAVVSDLLSDESSRAKMRARGLVRSGNFNWDVAARELLAIFGELSGEKAGHLALGTVAND